MDTHADYDNSEAFNVILTVLTPHGFIEADGERHPTVSFRASNGASVRVALVQGGAVVDYDDAPWRRGSRKFRSPVDAAVYALRLVKFRKWQTA